MRKLLSSLLALFLCLQFNMCMAQQDTCLKLFCPNDYDILTNTGSYNQDSVKVDDCPGSVTNGKIFAKKYFTAKFTRYPFDVLIPPNELKRVSDLSDSIPGLKEQFENLESELGIIYFKRSSKNNETNSDWLFDNGYITIFFENYQDIEYILEAFRSRIDSLIFIEYLQRYGFPLSVPNDIALRPNTKLSEINLNWKQDRDYWAHTWYEFYPSNFEPFGFQSNIYELNCPMAWEISSGSSTVTLAIADFWDFPSEHPDVIQNYYSPTNFGDGDEWDILNTGHGLACMSNAVARSDNDFPLVGTAPDCRAFSIYAGQNAIRYDLDQTVNRNMLYPDVKNCSYGGPGTSSSTMSRDDVDAGIVVVASAGNDRFRLNNRNDRVTTPKLDGSLEVMPTKNFPAATAYSDLIHPENPALDYRIIAVEATSSGINKNKYCEPWGPPYQQIGPNFTKDLQFGTVGNFSPGVQKFNTSTNIVTRLDEKEKAFVDLVAPGVGILSAAEFNPLPGGCDGLHPVGSAAWFTCKLADICITINNVPADIDFYMSSSSTITYNCNGSTINYREVQRRINGAIQDARKYSIWNGTSHAAPQVSGIAALMLSVSKFMGVPLSANGNPTNGEDVQRRAYNALTFTAKKIEDYQNFSSEKFTNPYDLNDHNIYFYSNSFPTGEAYQYEYKTQWNDNLKRSWAQRMGFGLVNAYRAVAHSIRQKGAYEYNLASSATLTFADNNGSGDSRGYVNPDGNLLMHWGGIVNEGTRPFELGANWRGPTTGNDDTLLVLEWGGVSLPGEFHNNQGVTRINHTGNSQQVAITFPDNCILAIDGILVSDQPQRSHFVYTPTSSTFSKILMEGWLQDVEIFGNLRIGDLTVLSTTDDLSGCVGLGSGPYISEIYGKVTLKDRAMLYSWGMSKFKPGSYIDMQGTKDIILNGGSNTVLEYGTTITGLPGRKIVVKSGAELNIEAKAKVDLLCELLVESGGILRINGDAVVRANKLTIEKNAQFLMFDGSVLALNDPEQFWDGMVTLSGTPTKNVQILGMLKETCLPIDDPDYTKFDYVYTAPTIYMKGSCPDAEKSLLTTNYVTFKNISIETHDFPITAITNCRFLSNTRLTNPYLNFKSLLSVYYNNCQTCNVPTIKNFTMAGTTFEDEAGFEPHPSDPDNWNRRIYRTGGLVITGLENVNINSCFFEGLEYGVATYDCDNVKIENSDFRFSGIGDYDFGSTTTLCNNDYLEVQYGSVRDHSLIGKAFDNWYWFSRIGFAVVASTQQRFRGNHFQEYFIGIRSSCSGIVMNTYYDYPNTWIYGHNLFEISPFSAAPDYLLGYGNRFISKNCEAPITADIGLVKPCCSLLMQGGHNGMSEHTWFHIRYEGPGAFPTIINVSNNSFPPNSWPVTYQVNTTHTPNTLGPAQYTQSTLYCGDYSEGGPLKADTTNDNSDNNGSLAMLISTLGEGDSKNLLYSYNSALRSSQPGNKLLVIDSLLSAIPVSGKEDFSDNLNIIKADLAYRLGDKEKSLKLLRDVEDGSGSILRLKAGEDTQGATASGLLGFVSAAVDVKCNDAQTAVDEAITGLELNLEQNRPNPFSNFTDIGFTLSAQSAVTLVVTDIYGNKVCTLLDNTVLAPGRHSAAFNTEELSSGVYVYTLFAEGSSISKRMQLVK